MQHEVIKRNLTKKIRNVIRKVFVVMTFSRKNLKFSKSLK